MNYQLKQFKKLKKEKEKEKLEYLKKIKKYLNFDFLLMIRKYYFKIMRRINYENWVEWFKQVELSVFW